MKNLKILIIILIIFSIGIIGAIIALNLQSKKTDSIIVDSSDEVISDSNTIYEEDIVFEEETNESINTPALTYETSAQEIQSETTLYSLSININKYFNYIKQGNTVAVDELGGNTVYTIANNCKFTLKKAYGTSNEYLAKYYIYGILYISNGDLTSTEQEIYMVVYRDLQNDTYKLETSSAEQMTNVEELSQEDKLEIKQQNYNKFETSEYVDNVKQTEIYLEDYSFQIFNNTEYAYNLLNEEYRNKRFGSIEEFIKYINQKQSELIDIKLTEYKVIEDDDIIAYVGKDKYGNYYKIIETAYMEYTVMLDNYTLKDYSDYSTEDLVKEYTKSFILMLNNKDYTNAYKRLEPTFRETNFPTQQDFENYVSQNFYERNVIATREVLDEENGICLVTMRENVSTLSNEMQKQFKVTLGEENEFTIEFNI